MWLAYCCIDLHATLKSCKLGLLSGRWKEPTHNIDSHLVATDHLSATWALIIDAPNVKVTVIKDIATEGLTIRMQVQSHTCLITELSHLSQYLAQPLDCMLTSVQLTPNGMSHASNKRRWSSYLSLIIITLIVVWNVTCTKQTRVILEGKRCCIYVHLPHDLLSLVPTLTQPRTKTWHTFWEFVGVGATESPLRFSLLEPHPYLTD